MEQIPEIRETRRGKNPNSLKALKAHQYKKGERAPGQGKGPKLGSENYLTVRRKALKKLAKDNKTTPEEVEVHEVANAIRLAFGGDYRFYADDMNRTYGQPTAKNEISGKDGEPLPLFDYVSTRNHDRED